MLLTGSEDCTLRDLEVQLGDQMDLRVRDARMRLQQSADILTREVGMNRKLLREALSSNDKHIRTLVGGSTTTSTYNTEPSSVAIPEAPRDRLVNRTV